MLYIVVAELFQIPTIAFHSAKTTILRGCLNLDGLLAKQSGLCNFQMELVPTPMADLTNEVQTTF